MLSRRSVRIKVMQLLYAMDRNTDLEASSAEKRYMTRVDRSYELLLFNVYILKEITRLAVDDKRKRKAKHLPTEIDEKFTAKLFKNDIIQSLENDKALTTCIDKYRLKDKLDKDYFKKIYTEFSQLEVYQEYIMNDTHDHSSTVNILLDLFRHCRQSEFYNDAVEDHYAEWIDDKSLVIGAVKKIIKALPEDAQGLIPSFYPDNETVKDFGLNLLNRTLENKQVLEQIIKPLLQNWDHDRLAIIDNILLKMAAAEFLYFESIPTKVTLNEYVDISKLYSTPKSKDFINGVLDHMMKQLHEEGKIEKRGRGLIEE